MKTCQRGITLLEILIIFTITGIVLACGAPSFASYQRGQRLHTAALTTASLMRIARDRSVTFGKWYMLRFDPARQDITLSTLDQFAGVADTTEVKRYKFTDPAVRLGRADFHGHSTLVFYPDGSCSATGTVDITDGRDRLVLSTLGSTGRVWIK